MPAIFAILRTTRLSRARLVLLEGRLLEGALLVGQRAELAQAEQRHPVQVLGVLEGDSADPSQLQVTLAARGLAAWRLAPGDQLRQE